MLNKLYEPLWRAQTVYGRYNKQINKLVQWANGSRRLAHFPQQPNQLPYPRKNKFNILL